MTDKENVQASGSGCLARIFTIIGLFWLGLLVVDAIGFFQSGGDLGEFDVAGGIVPAVAFLIAGRVMGKRAREAAAEAAAAPTTRGPAPTVRAPSAERGPTPSPLPTPRPASEAPPAPQARPSRPVPELPPIEPVPDSRGLEAIEDLDISDFEPGKPMTSEERIREARERYLPKRPRSP